MWRHSPLISRQDASSLLEPTNIYRCCSIQPRLLEGQDPALSTSGQTPDLRKAHSYSLQQVRPYTGTSWALALLTSRPAQASGHPDHVPSCVRNRTPTPTPPPPQCPPPPTPSNLTSALGFLYLQRDPRTQLFLPVVWH